MVYEVVALSSKVLKRLRSYLQNNKILKKQKKWMPIMGVHFFLLLL